MKVEEDLLLLFVLSVAHTFTYYQNAWLLININTLAGEDPELGSDNLEAKLNDDDLQTNTNDNDDKLNEQPQNENEQVMNSGEGSNGMGDVDTVIKDDIHVDPAGKELEATFYEKDDILVTESPEMIEKLEENSDITSTDTPIDENINEGKQ